MLVAVVEAVVGAVTARPLRDAAVVCLARELRVLVTLVIGTPWKRRRERHMGGRSVRHTKMTR